jgi:spermidine/putrescine transport system ATP-binding protein
MNPAVELRDVSKTFSDRSAGRDVSAVRNVNLSIRPGEFFTLLGPSGCGKTTTLRLIAGFETASAGEIIVQGQSMSRVPPHLRPVNTVFQSYALFPHLTVAQNVGFGLAVKRAPRAERQRRIAEALDMVRLPDMGQRRPSQLSGGQQQRVALARALVNRPAVLLLDEPLGALDLKLRKEMQLELKALQHQVGITFIYVTHDQEEALTMSDRIAVMSHGVVLQVDDPMTIYEKPATRFVADFIGETNFLSGTLLAASNGHAHVSVAGNPVTAQTGDAPLADDQPVTIAVRPEKVVLAQPGAASGTGLSGIIREMVYLGTDTRYVVHLLSGERVVARVQNAPGRGRDDFHVDDTVAVSWELDDARVLTS